MNTNSVVGLIGGTSRGQIPSLSVTVAATATMVKVNTDTGSVQANLALPLATAVVGSNNPIGVNANPAILSPALGAALQSAGTNRPYFNSASFNGRPIRVRLSGTGVSTANAAQTAIVNIYFGTSATPATTAVLATTGTALAMVAGGAFSFSLVADLLWDSGTGLIVGSQTGSLAFGSAQQYTVPKAIANIPASVTLANVQFSAGVLMGDATTASTVQVTEFAIDVL